MNNKDPLVFIKHIVESIKFIEEFSQDLTEEELSKNRLKQDAIVRELEIIGEAIKNLPSEFTDKYKKVDWKDLAGLRDKLIHHYFGVDIEIVWNTIKEDIPKLKKEILNILDKEK